MKKLFFLLGTLRPKNIHDLNRLIENGYAAWQKVYRFLADSAGQAQELVGDAEAAAEKIVADMLAGSSSEPAAPPSTRVEA